jgi:hypothetical protein
MIQRQAMVESRTADEAWNLSQDPFWIIWNEHEMIKTHEKSVVCRGKTTRARKRRSAVS